MMPCLFRNKAGNRNSSVRTKLRTPYFIGGYAERETCQLFGNLNAFGIIFIFVFSLPLFSFSQEEETTPRKNKGAKGFHAGLYIGSFWANKYSTRLYDGWGYNELGERNDFYSSFMYRRIVIDFGGGNGQTDYVAQALEVNQGEWTFDETDMPTRMRYTTSVMAGLNMDFGFTKKDALIVNINVSKVNAGGNFTIVVINPQIGPQQPGYQDIRTFSITGSEQRLIVQLGYRRITGNVKKSVVNFFYECGLLVNRSEFLRNSIAINNLHIDLGYYYTQPYFPTYRASFLRGTGYGVFAGMGCTVTANPKWTLHLLYNPSFEKINIGESPRLKYHNAAGIRAYFNF